MIMHATPPSSRVSLRQTGGAVTLFLGIGILTLILLDSLQTLPWDFPRTWYVHRPLWGAAGLVLCVTGWMLQRSPADPNPVWKPAVPGRRFTRLIVYSRHDCHLCDDAKAILHGYLDHLPPIEDVDIDGDPQLQEQHGLAIPVVEIDGTVRFRGHIDEQLLRRLIEATPPTRDA